MSADDFQTAPTYEQKFKASTVKALIGEVLEAKLGGQAFNPDTTSQWTKEIADEIKGRLKALELDRYKFVVQVTIGEQRGEGVKMGARCFWDEQSDAYAQDVFTNDSLFAVAAAFGCYYY